MPSYQKLAYFFPREHRTTLYRWVKDGKVRAPDLTVGNVPYWLDDVPPTLTADEVAELLKQREIANAET